MLEKEGLYAASGKMHQKLSRARKSANVKAKNAREKVTILSFEKFDIPDDMPVSQWKKEATALLKIAGVSGRFEAVTTDANGHRTTRYVSRDPDSMDFYRAFLPTIQKAIANIQPTTESFSSAANKQHSGLDFDIQTLIDKAHEDQITLVQGNPRDRLSDRNPQEIEDFGNALVRQKMRERFDL